MNYLGHFFLTRNENSNLKLGNFIGDFVKGRKPLENFEPQVAKGIILHRAIDDFTDKHPSVSASKSKLFDKYRHYSAVLIDVFYDHFLASNFNRYSNQRLENYTKEVYTFLNTHFYLLPPKAQYILPFMENNNWLLNYKYLEGIQRACVGLSKRTKFRSHMEHGYKDLVVYYDDFRTDFFIFFDEIQDFVYGWIKDNTD